MDKYINERADQNSLYNKLKWNDNAWTLYITSENKTEKYWRSSRIWGNSSKKLEVVRLVARGQVPRGGPRQVCGAPLLPL
jgi:hypothetical protein